MRFLILAALAATVALSACQTTPNSNSTSPTSSSLPRRGELELDWPWQESDLRADPAVRYGRLENGMRYAIMANHTPSNTASIRMRFNVGSLMEDDDQRGLAHFIEHMAFNGSTNVPEGDMVRLLERRGLSFGAHTNAYTSFDETVYMLDAPNVDEETIRTTFFLMRELASNLSILPDAVDRERGVILSEERSRNTPSSRALIAQWQFLFPDARFADRFPIGTVDIIRNAPAQRLRDLYESYYRPERAFFVIVGDVDPDAAEARIRETFGDWRATRPDPGNPELGSIAAGGAAGYFYDPDLPTTATITAVRPPLSEPNTSVNLLRSILRYIGNAIVTRRLQTLSRDASARFQAGEASGREIYDSADVSQIELVSRPEDWEASLAIAEQEMRRAIEHGFTQAELDEQIALMRTNYRTAAAQSATRVNAEIANAIVSEFNAWGVFMEPGDELTLFEHIASELTPPAAQAAFRAQWAGADPRVFLGVSREIPDAAQRELAVLDESRHQPVSAPVSTGALTWAYTNFGSTGTVADSRRIEDLGITTIRFANNVRLNVKPTNFADDSIYVTLRFGGGTLELPKSEPGLDLLFAALAEGGLEAHSADELQHLLGGAHVGVQFGTDADAFVISGITRPTDVELQLELMAAYLTAPGYRAEALAQFRQDIQIQVPTLDATPGGIARRDVPRLLRSGDPRYGIPSEDELMMRDFGQLRAALDRASRSGFIEIGIVGDIDVARATELVARTFGALSPRDRTPLPFNEARQIAFPAPTSMPIVLRHAGAANRARALIFWPTVDDSNARRMRTLQLLRGVLELKLTARVRENEGATYAPTAQASFAHASPGYGYVGISLDLLPQDVQRFFGVVDEITASMASGAITEDELERARRPVLDSFRNSLEDNGYWLSLTALAQTDLQQLERHRSTVTDYQAVTIADLRQAAGRYLQANSAYRVAILPPVQSR